MKVVLVGADARVGLIEEDRVLDISSAAHGKAGFSSLLALIEAGEIGLQRARSLARAAPSLGFTASLEETKLRAPWPGQRLALVGSNHPAHIAAIYTNMGAPTTLDQARANGRSGEPGAFWATARPIMGPEEKIRIPARATNYFDFEGEAAVVIGKQGKDIKAENATDYIWGLTLIHDWSAREPVWPPTTIGPLMLSKNFDDSKSIGPAIAVGEADIDDLPVETHVNGRLRQQFNMRDMTFSFAEILEYLSQDFTFYPGDVISMGTGPGTALDQTIPDSDGEWPAGLFLKPGDIVEVRSPSIGCLRSAIVAKST